MPNDGHNHQQQDVRASISKSKVVYVPPHPRLIAELAHTACLELGHKKSSYTNPEVIGGLTSFLTFYAQRLATYANNGHADLVLKEKTT